MLAPRLAEIGDPHALHATIEEIVGATEADAAARAELVDYAQARLAGIRALAASLDDPDDQLELYRTMAAFWLELRFEWQRHNEVMNYQVAHRGHADARIVATASIGSAILGRIETLLDQSHLQLLTSYALELLAAAQPHHVARREAA
jgi:hypothetical protein